MKIITITLNPAFDIHYYMDSFNAGKENYAEEVFKNAGGKGINISRALTAFGIENKALCVMGEENSGEFINALKKEMLSLEPILKSGRIRDNITLHTKSGETRISDRGGKCDGKVLDNVYDAIKREYEENMIVTFTGSLCPGISIKRAKEFIGSLKCLGIKVIVDCNSFSKEDLFDIKPFLIKPNEQEVAKLTGVSEVTCDNAILAARMFYDAGIENVMVSLGADGFVFCNKNGEFGVRVPEISAVSSIGAGDSTIAGFIAGMMQYEDVLQILRLAGAFGTGACLTDGTNPPSKECILNIFKDVECEKFQI